MSMIDGYELDELREKASMAEKEIPLLKSRVAYLEARCDLADEQIEKMKCCGNCGRLKARWYDGEWGVFKLQCDGEGWSKDMRFDTPQCKDWATNWEMKNEEKIS